MADLHAIEISREQLRLLLPHPEADANKYTRGKLHVVGGSSAYPGAACLAAYAAQRSGAGYVELHCAPESRLVAQSYRPSLVARSWDELTASAWPQCTGEKPSACVLGPGLESFDPKQLKLALRIIQVDRMPLLADGGAISALATGEGRLAAAARKNPMVVTPHGGEAARMAKAARFDSSAAEEAWPAERLALELARSYSCVIALKGPDTFISDGERIVAVRQGTAALAKAGTGDVLAGIIGALLAQGVDAMNAAVLGVNLHADAGCLAAEKLTDIAVTPEDVIEFIPAALKALPVSARRP